MSVDGKPPIKYLQKGHGIIYNIRKAEKNSLPRSHRFIPLKVTETTLANVMLFYVMAHIGGLIGLSLASRIHATTPYMGWPLN
jgi:hypothetical protein